MTDHNKSLWTINPTGQDCLVLAATIAAGSVAFADTVRFDNTTGFGWYGTTLDLTLSAEDQVYGGVGDVTGTSIFLDYFGDSYNGQYYSFSYNHTYTNGAGAEIWNSGWQNRYAAPFDSGQTVGPGMVDGVFNNYSDLEFAWSSYDYYTGESDSGFRGLLPPDGSDTYMGARLTIDNQLHYGWIGVQNQSGNIRVFAWGYETDAGVGIAAGAVPAPSTLGLLAIGAVGALGRKRRA